MLFVEEGEPVEIPPAKLERHEPPPQSEQVFPNGVLRLDADVSSTRSGDGKGKVDVDVAVLDGGIERNHPDLNVAGGINCLAGGRRNDWADRTAHGAFVGGIVGSLDNRFGVVGYAPGARLYGVRVAGPDELSEYGSRISLCGIDWVAETRLDDERENDIEVANMSLSGIEGCAVRGLRAQHRRGATISRSAGWSTPALSRWSRPATTRSTLRSTSRRLTTRC